MKFISQIFEEASGKWGNNTAYTRMGSIVLRRRSSSKKADKADRVRAYAFAYANKFASYHQRNIRECVEPMEGLSSHQTFLKLNGHHLMKALETLALRTVDTGEVPTVAEIDNAVSTYATANPTKIQIVKASGAEASYLTGSWPATITIRPVGSADATVNDLRGTDGGSGNGNVPPQGNDDDAIGE